LILYIRKRLHIYNNVVKYAITNRAGIILGTAKYFDCNT
jgi:hypothetical protein